MDEILEQNLIDSLERALLATILFDKSTLDIVVENVFSNHRYRDIFEVIKTLVKDGLPLHEEMILSRLDSSYQQSILDILSTNPIVSIKPVYEKLVENSHKNYINQELRKIVICDESSISKIQKLEKLIEKSREFKRGELFEFVDFSLVEEKSPNFFLEDILPIQEREINIISAAGGSGKSYISLFLAINFVERYKDKSCFLWLSEDEIGVSKKRANNICKIHKLRLNNKITVIGKETTVFHFVNKNLAISDKFELLKRQLKRFDLIVLDPLIAFYGADENSNAEARYFMSLLNKWCVDDNKTIILIHHHSKSNAGVKSNARGASAFIDACRMHYIVEKVEQDDTSRKLIIDKTNHFEHNKKEYIIRLFDKKIDEMEIIYNQTDSLILGDIFSSEVDEL